MVELFWRGRAPSRSTDHSIFLTSERKESVSNFFIRNVVVVTVNYRLGALGFLCLGSNLVTMNRDPFSV